MPELPPRRPLTNFEAPRIRRLDPALIDQIAAGEVVERPASVAKELVENALDAGAERVRVELRDGGRSFLAVTDDGCGMTPEEARLALERHATSKLASSDDLRAITSFGFRGEALPAIASVSKLRLRTRARGQEEAWEIRVDGGRRELDRAAAGPEGTRIEVAELFAHVPARRKFLKTDATEWSHVADWLARVALARPDVHFDVQRDGRPSFAWPAVENPVDRVAAVLSEEQAAALVPVSAAAGDVRVAGHVSRPDHHRGTAAGIHLYVNGRPVRDRLLRHALLDVYRDVIPRGRFPTAILFVEVPTAAVDVNVHPAKWEVRFADPRAVHRALREAVRGALGERRWLGGAAAAAPYPPAREFSGFGPGSPGEARVADAPAGDWLFAQSAREPVPDSIDAAAATAPLRFSDLQLVGQVLGTYLIVEGKDAVLMVDQHAAHERVLYERLRAAWLEGGVERQALLLTETVELEPGAVAALVESAELALRLGFELEAFGEGAVAVRAVPALLAGLSPASLVRSLADELREGAGDDARARSRMLPQADHILATLACHSSRRAGEVLPAGEQRAILEALDTIPWAPTCPHGRPVAVPLERGEIERRFGRR